MWREVSRLARLGIAASLMLLTLSLLIAVPQVVYADPDYPQVAGTNDGNNNTNSTSHTVNLPADIAEGDLLLVFFVSDGTPTVTFPADEWTKLGSRTSGSAVTLELWYRIADGEEGSTISVTTSASERSAHTSYRITGYCGTPEAGWFAATSTSRYPNPPVFCPSWGEAETLWIAGGAWDNGTYTLDFGGTWNYPDNYDDNQAVNRSNNSAGVGVATASRNRTVACENPMSFTLVSSANVYTIGVTVVIHPRTSPVLTVTKVIDNTGDGTATYDDFRQHVLDDQDADVSGSPFSDDGAGTQFTLTPGTYTVTEESFTDYVTTFSGDCDADGSVTLNWCDNKTATVTNTYAPPKLTVTKVIDDSEGGTAAYSDFQQHVLDDQDADVSGSPFSDDGSGTQFILTSGNYNVTEDGFEDYETTFSGDCDSDGSITLTAGDVKSITVTNKYVPPPVLTVIKVIDNTAGGTATYGDFQQHVLDDQDADVSGSPFSDVGTGTQFVLKAGDYTVTEDGFAHYVTTYSGDCDPDGSITLSARDVKTVTVTNTYVPPVSIGNSIFRDFDGDGVQSAFEPGIKGVLVELYLSDGDAVFDTTNTDTLLDSQVTGNGGTYLFAGLSSFDCYWILVDESTLPAGATLTSGANPMGPFCLSAGTILTDADFGFRFQSQTTPQAVGGQAYPIDKSGLMAQCIVLGLVLAAGAVYVTRRMARARAESN